MGYNTTSKGYRIFNVETRKVLVNRNVKFDESAMWNWNKNEAESIETSQQGVGISYDQVEAVESSDSDTGAPVRGTRLLTNIYDRCNAVMLEPSDYIEASKSDEWKVAMQEDLNMIEKNGTWSLVDRPENKKVIGVKWVFRIKLNPNVSINKLKVRLVVKGYSQEYGVDFIDTFAPVARYDTIRLLIALAAQNGWKIFQLDVKSAFLNGLLEEDIYVEQPEGFPVSGGEDKVYKLHKALYGLKQAPRAWYSRIDDYLRSLGFSSSINEHTLYVKQVGADLLIVSLYIDDLLVTGSNSTLIENFKNEMQKRLR